MKKLLSIILVSAMVLALVPSAFATTTEDDLVLAYNFDFGAAGYAGIAGQTGETEIDRDTLKSYGDTSEDRDASSSLTWAEVNTNKWVVDGHYRCIEDSYDFVNITLTGNSDSDNKKANALYWAMLGTRAWKNGSAQSGAAAVAVRINIDETGAYIPALTFYARADLCIYDVYLIPYSSLNNTQNKYLKFSKSNLPGIRSDDYFLGKLDMYNATPGDKTTFFSNYTASSGDYILLFCPNGLNETLQTKYASKNAPASYANLFSFKLYREKTVEEAATEEFVPTPEDDYTEAPETATVTRLAYYGEDENGAPITDTLGTSSVTYGESVTIDGAAQTVTKNNKTYNFLYWARGLDDGVGNKTILSTDLSFPYKPGEGNNYLIAVYEEEGNAEEAFYNKNGQLLTDLKITDGALPALPAMAGLGNATAWVQRGTNLEFEGGAAAPETGDMVFMAKYAEPEADITINGGKFKYGDTVSCISLEDTGYAEENFSYWTRTIGGNEPEIISIDANYSFSAFADCTIEAVCNGAVTLDNPRKIALSTFSVGDNLTAVMAEFIGFGAAKEKGIMFGGKKIAMTTDKVQFTVTNDTKDAVEVTGYAIVGNDKYVDGEITVAAAR